MSAVVIINAGRAIGLACAKPLPQAGCPAVLIDPDSSALQTAVDTLAAEGFAVNAFECDVTESAQVATVALSAAEMVGLISVLINNAGLSSPATIGWGYRQGPAGGGVVAVIARQELRV